MVRLFWNVLGGGLYYTSCPLSGLMLIVHFYHSFCGYFTVFRYFGGLFLAVYPMQVIIGILLFSLLDCRMHEELYYFSWQYLVSTVEIDIDCVILPFYFAVY